MRCEVLDLGLVRYNAANQIQFSILEKVKSEAKENTIILAEFFPVYTIGRKGSLDNLLVSSGFLNNMGIECCNATRGGDITFHGRGQLVAYPIFNLSCMKKDLNWYLRSLEEVVINVLSDYGIYAGRKIGLTGVWVQDEKVASIGIAVSRWTTYHGLSLNVNNDLSFFDFINPCGIKDCKMTSISKLKDQIINMHELKNKLIEQFERVFGLEINAGNAAAMA